MRIIKAHYAMTEYKKEKKANIFVNRDYFSDN